MLLDEAVIGMFGGRSPFLDVVLRFCGGGPRQAVSVFFGGVMVPSFKGISRGGVKKKAVGAVLDPPPIIMECKVDFVAVKNINATIKIEWHIAKFLESLVQT